MKFKLQINITIMRKCQTIQFTVATYNTNSPFEDEVNWSTIIVCGIKQSVFVQYVHEKQILGDSIWKNKKLKLVFTQNATNILFQRKFKTGKAYLATTKKIGMSLILPKTKVTVKVWFWLIYLKVLHLKKQKSKELSVNMEVNKHLKKFSENVKMKCILFKNNKKSRGSENGASLSSWLMQVGIIAFAHGLLAVCSPAQGGALLC